MILIIKYAKVKLIKTGKSSPKRLILTHIVLFSVLGSRIQEHLCSFIVFFGILIEAAELYEFDKKRNDRDTRALTWQPREGHKLDLTYGQTFDKQS